MSSSACRRALPRIGQSSRALRGLTRIGRRRATRGRPRSGCSRAGAHGLRVAGGFRESYADASFVHEHCTHDSRRCRRQRRRERSSGFSGAQPAEDPAAVSHLAARRSPLACFLIRINAHSTCCSRRFLRQFHLVGYCCPRMLLLFKYTVSTMTTVLAPSLALGQM